MEKQTAYISQAWVSKSFGYTESVDEDTGLPKIILEGEFQRSNKNNRNQRRYSNPLLNRETSKLREIIEVEVDILWEWIIQFLMVVKKV